MLTVHLPKVANPGQERYREVLWVVPVERHLGYRRE